MSSSASSTPISSTLTLELKPSWPVLGLMSGWLLLMAVAIPAVAPVFWPGKVVIGCAVLVAGAFLLKSQLFGFGARALQRASLNPDGQWLLTDSRGGQWPAILSADSRPLAGVVFLSWKAPERHDWAVVAGPGVNREALRRLRMRLRRG